MNVQHLSLTVLTATLALTLAAPLHAEPEGPEAAAEQFMKELQVLDLDAMQKHLCDPEARDILALYALKVEDDGDRRKDLFRYRHNKMWGLELVEVDWLPPHTRARVAFRYYLSEEEKPDPIDRIGFAGDDFESAWERITISLTLFRGKWWVTDFKGDIDPGGRMRWVLDQKRQ